MTYITPAAAAAEIRSELKTRYGWTSRQVSVRASSFSGGSAIDIKIKAAGVSVEAVKAIAEGQESIHRCEITGEILSGANRYVSVTLDWELVRREGAKLVAWVEETPVHPSQLRDVEVCGEVYLIGRTRSWDFSVFRRNGGFVPAGQSAQAVAEFFAGLMIQAGVEVEVPAAPAPEPAAPAAPALAEVAAQAVAEAALAVEAAEAVEEFGEELVLTDDKPCVCGRPVDDGLGFCNSCGHWINDRGRERMRFAAGAWEGTVAEVRGEHAPAPVVSIARFQAITIAPKAAPDHRAAVDHLLAGPGFDAALSAHGVTRDDLEDLCRAAEAFGLDERAAVDLLCFIAARYVTLSAFRIALDDEDLVRVMLADGRRRADREARSLLSGS